MADASYNTDRVPLDAEIMAVGLAHVEAELSIRRLITTWGDAPMDEIRSTALAQAKARAQALLSAERTLRECRSMIATIKNLAERR